MIRTDLHYHRPAEAAEAGALLAEHRGDAVVLGGGTLLLPMLGRAEITAGHVVDLRGLGVDTITEADGAVRVGAMATYTDLATSPLVAARLPVLARMAAGVTGGAQLRNLATAGGSACYGNPSSEVPAVLVALDAELVLCGSAGERRVPAAEFFRGAFSTAREPDEFLATMVFPVREHRAGYHKLKLCEGSWPIVTAAAVACDGRLTVTVGAATATPLRVDVDGAADIDPLLQERITAPWSDVLADGGYRKDVSGAVARRALADLEAIMTDTGRRS